MICQVFFGSCEQFEYVFDGHCRTDILACIKQLSFMERSRFYSINTDRKGYPKGSQHYRYVGRRETFLCIFRQSRDKKHNDIVYRHRQMAPRVCRRSRASRPQESAPVTAS